MLGINEHDFQRQFLFDTSDAISADYIIEQSQNEPRGTCIVVDYLQLLDQQREKPELMVQIKALKAFAEEKGLTILCISQIDRAFDADSKVCPDLSDVRLPIRLIYHCSARPVFSTMAPWLFRQTEPGRKSFCGAVFTPQRTVSRHPYDRKSRLRDVSG